MLKRLTASAAAVACLHFSWSAHAGLLNHVTLTEGASEINLAIDDININVTALEGTLMNKTVFGVTGTGVSGGAVPGEIDGAQCLIFTFSQPVHITSMSIVHLFTAGNYNDQWNEVARFITDEGAFELEAADATNANWSGFGSVVNDSPAIEGSSGAWTVNGNDIFGGPITSLMLISGNPGPLARYSDFGFFQLSFLPMPSPGALALLGLAALAAGGRKRR
jgi:hypothetical protein